MAKSANPPDNRARPEHGVPTPPQPATSPPAAAPSLLSASASGASFLILLQLLSRLLTFGVNQLLLRYLSPELLGISTQLELYSITVLFFSRESLRIALQRQQSDAPASSTTSTASIRAQTIINLSYLPLVLGVPISLLLSTLYLHTSPASLLSTPYFPLSLHIFTLAALLELLAEPFFILNQHLFAYRTRASVEALATTARCLATCLAAIYAARHGLVVGALPFALGQLTYACCLLGAYLCLTDLPSQLAISLLPRRIYSSSPSISSTSPSPISSSTKPSKYILHLFSTPHLSLATTLSLQSFLKHLLTQGDTLLISLLCPLPAQGIYALASNYGSLIARLLFQPIEESARGYFARLLTPSPPPKSQTRSALSTLNLILHFYFILSLLIVALLPSLFPLFFRVLTSSSSPTSSSSGSSTSKWSAAYPALSAYSYYIPLLALNGLLEAFVSAVATPAQLRAQSAAMLGFSAGFAAAGYVFLSWMDLGARGLVVANGVNMVLRILWALAFLRGWKGEVGGMERDEGKDEGEERIEGWAVAPATLAVAVGGAAAMRGLDTDGWHGVMRAGAVAAVTGISVLWVERAFLLRCWGMARPGLPATTRNGKVRGKNEKENEKETVVR